MIPFSKSAPMDVGPRDILPLVGFTKVGEHRPDPPLLTTHINTTIPMTSTVSPWGKGDSVPCPFGKTKYKQISWQISDPEFQNVLQIARAVQPTDQMGKQHAIIYCMIKHERQQNGAKTAPPFMIPNGITKELADMMQVWILNKSASPPAVRQLPNDTIYIT